MKIHHKVQESQALCHGDKETDQDDKDFKEWQRNHICMLRAHSMRRSYERLIS